MSVLLLDIGNSRVKWTFVEDGRLAPMQAKSHQGQVAEAVAALMAGPPPVSQIVVSDVTGRASLETTAATRVTRVVAQAGAHGVTNAYRAPARLGPDRWAALVGAHHLGHGATLVVDAGSALTLDMLTADGRHLGGWIVPGLRMAMRALRDGTRGVQVQEGTLVSNGVPGCDTDSAVVEGAVQAAVGLIERGQRLAVGWTGSPPAVVLTGGDAASLAAHLPDAVRVDDLVLRGLAHWVGEDTA